MNKKIKLWLAYVLVTSYIVGGNAFVYRIAGSFSLKLSEAISFIAIGVLLFSKGRPKLYKYEKRILLWIVLSVGASIIGLALFKYSIKDFAVGLVYPIRIILLLYAVKYVQYAFGINHISTGKAIDFIMSNYVVLCLIGLFQFLVFPVARNWYQVFWSIGSYKDPMVDPHVRRMISTYMDPNFLAACLLIPFTIALHRWQGGRKKGLWQMALFTLSIILTVSRSGFLGLALIVVLSFIKFHASRKQIERNIILVAGLIVFAIVLFSSNVAVINRIFNSANDESTYMRFRSWETSIDIFMSNPLTGIGYNMFQAFINSRNIMINGADSSLILILMTSGFIGILYFAWSIFITLHNNRQRNKKNGFKTIRDLFFTAIVICNFNNLLFYVLWLFPMILISDIYIEQENKLSKESVFNIIAT